MVVACYRPRKKVTIATIIPVSSSIPLIPIESTQHGRMNFSAGADDDTCNEKGGGD
jgi:hypothetical protein